MQANPTPAAKEKGILFAFNPTDKTITANVTVPLYYTGLETTVSLTRGAGAVAIEEERVQMTLRRDYRCALWPFCGPG